MRQLSERIAALDKLTAKRLAAAEETYLEERRRIVHEDATERVLIRQQIRNDPAFTKAIVSAEKLCLPGNWYGIDGNPRLFRIMGTITWELGVLDNTLCYSRARQIPKPRRAVPYAEVLHAGPALLPADERERVEFLLANLGCW